MLTRFDEEIRQGSDTLDAVWVALSRAGRVVFVSGVTLGLTNGECTQSSAPEKEIFRGCQTVCSEQSRRSDVLRQCMQ